MFCSDQDSYAIKLLPDLLLSLLKSIVSYPIILTYYLKLTGYCGLIGMMCVLILIATALLLR